MLLRVYTDQSHTHSSIFIFTDYSTIIILKKVGQCINSVRRCWVICCFTVMCCNTGEVCEAMVRRHWCNLGQDLIIGNVARMKSFVTHSSLSNLIKKTWGLVGCRKAVLKSPAAKMKTTKVAIVAASVRSLNNSWRRRQSLQCTTKRLRLTSFFLCLYICSWSSLPGISILSRWRV